MQLAPPLFGLTIKTALAADLSHVWGVRMLSDCGAYLAPKMPAVGNNIFRGAVLCYLKLLIRQLKLLVQFAY